MVPAIIFFLSKLMRSQPEGLYNDEQSQIMLNITEEAPQGLLKYNSSNHALIAVQLTFHDQGT